MEEKYKETARKVLKFVKSIAPAIETVADGHQFELVITKDGEGIDISCSVGVDEIPENELGDLEVLDVSERTPESFEAIERNAFAKALQKTNGDKRKAAEMLGLSERTFNRKLKKYRIELSKH